MTLTLKRGGSFVPAKQLGVKLRGVGSYLDVCEFVFVSRTMFSDAVAVLERYDDQALSFTDTTTITLCRRRDIDAVLSCNDDSDELIEWIDPASI